MAKQEERTRTASQALRSAVKFADEVISITEFNLPLTVLNRTQTVYLMQQHIKNMQAFIDEIKKPQGLA